jgi:hypothetical protein
MKSLFFLNLVLATLSSSSLRGVIAAINPRFMFRSKRLRVRQF